MPVAPTPENDRLLLELQAGPSVPAPAPLSAQPGEAAAPPRTEVPPTQSAGGQRLQPRESPSAGDVLPEGRRLDARASSAFPHESATQKLPSRVSKAEQSNTSILFDDRLFLKIFRRLQAEENPDVEMGRFLTEIANFPRIPPFLGEISISLPGTEKTTVIMLQRLIPNEGDGWQWFLNELVQRLAAVTEPGYREYAGFCISGQPRGEAGGSGCGAIDVEAAALLGRRTAEMHLALSSSADLPAFAPQPMREEDLTRDAERIEAQIKSTLEALKPSCLLSMTPPAMQPLFCSAAGPRSFSAPARFEPSKTSGQRIRIHGDYHLGQTLRTATNSQPPTGADDFVLIDFKGEPGPADRGAAQEAIAAQRCSRHDPFLFLCGPRGCGLLRDERCRCEGAPDSNVLSGWAQRWQTAASARFLRAYGDAVASNPALLPDPGPAQALLEAYLLEKALYEVLYELDHRPAWLRIPIDGILAL